jgi:hypothetical protein
VRDAVLHGARHLVGDLGVRLDAAVRGTAEADRHSAREETEPDRRGCVEQAAAPAVSATVKSPAACIVPAWFLLLSVRASDRTTRPGA